MVVSKQNRIQKSQSFAQIGWEIVDNRKTQREAEEDEQFENESTTVL